VALKSTPAKRGKNMVAAVTDTAMYQNSLKLNRYEPGWLSRASMKASVRFAVAVETGVGVVDIVAAYTAATTFDVGLGVFELPIIFEDSEAVL
jgi:hypothetical protein